LAQYDGEFPILNTKYPADYEEVLSHFRRVTQNNELSMRVFHLTTEVINWICGSYTAWYVRRQCVEKLEIDLNKEYEFVMRIFPSNEKTYQLWEYKKYLATKLKQPEREIEFLDEVLSKDNKNYHAWSFRIWLCEEFKLHDSELKRIESFIDDDVGNNSAWNYRYFLVKDKMTEEKLHDEIKYTMDRIYVRPDNEASWNYLNGWFHMFSFKALDPNPELKSKHLKKFDIKQYPTIEKFCEEIISGDPEVRFAYSTLIQIYLYKGSKDLLKKAIEFIEDLAENKDKIRYLYWNWFKKQIEELL